MANIAPIQAGPVKITFPTNLPKNEKDLICMLLAGRLKDLLNGKLVCAQLAIDDLIKDMTGVSALGEMRSALNDMKAGLKDLQKNSSYTDILNNVNQGLHSINDVFSLGGLCPDPVHAPKIPDVLAQMNMNLMGQANDILNGLTKVANPSMCLGGTPGGGFGVNWNSLTGDLKNLKRIIAEVKKDPGRMKQTIAGFEANLKGQVKRMKSEIKRLQKNLSDPLGINDKKKTVAALSAAKNVSDGYKVKDKRGIQQPVLKSMVPADVEHVLNRTDALSTTPILYATRPVLDYCGDVVGYEKYAVSGDPNYIGWDTNPDANNGDNPTALPLATQAEYDYLFVKSDAGQIKVYDTLGNSVETISLARGSQYRIGIELDATQGIRFYTQDNTLWNDGITYTRGYGNEIQVIEPDESFSDNFTNGEVDWAVLIESPTTPDSLYWRSADGTTGQIEIAGPTSIPYKDRVYDISMAVKKGSLNITTVEQAIPDTTETVKFEQLITTRRYKGQAGRYFADGNPIVETSTDEIKFGLDGYDVEPDTETNNLTYTTGNKIIKSILNFENGKYLIVKRYVSDDNGYEFNKLSVFISTSKNETDAETCILINYKNPISLLNSSRLPFTDNYSHTLTFLEKNSAGEYVPTIMPITRVQDTTFELIENYQKATDTTMQLLRWNLTDMPESKANVLGSNEFIFQIDYKLPDDPTRTFTNADPIEYRMYFRFNHETKGRYGFELNFLDDAGTPPMTLALASTDTYTISSGEKVTPFIPATPLNNVGPVTYSISPALPAGLVFDPATGEISGTPE
jgi:hypothetical protein